MRALPLLLNWWLLKDSEVKSSSNVYSLGGAHQVPLDCSIPVITQMPWGQLSESQNKKKVMNTGKGPLRGMLRGIGGR